MNLFLIIGVGIVIFAFGSYTTAFLTQIRHRRSVALMRGFLTAGVALDVTATAYDCPALEGSRSHSTASWATRHPCSWPPTFS